MNLLQLNYCLGQFLFLFWIIGRLSKISQLNICFLAICKSWKAPVFKSVHIGWPKMKWLFFLKFHNLQMMHLAKSYVRCQKFNYKSQFWFSNSNERWYCKQWVLNGSQNQNRSALRQRKEVQYMEWVNLKTSKNLYWWMSSTPYIYLLSHQYCVISVLDSIECLLLAAPSTVDIWN